jgi:hypothetical protein
MTVITTALPRPEASAAALEERLGLLERDLERRGYHYEAYQVRTMRERIVAETSRTKYT